MGAIATKELNRIVVSALGRFVKAQSPLDTRPLDIDFISDYYPKHVRIYCYTVTHPRGGRARINEVEHKIQLIIPGQSRNERADFDFSSDRFVIMMGYEPKHNVFVIWDASCYRNISYSRNVQVQSFTIISAYAKGMVYQKKTRQVTDDPNEEDIEFVLAGRCEFLPALLEARLSISPGMRDEARVLSLLGSLMTKYSGR